MERSNKLEVEVPTAVMDALDTLGASINATTDAARARLGLPAVESCNTSRAGTPACNLEPLSAVVSAAHVGRRVVSGGSEWMYRPVRASDAYFVAPSKDSHRDKVVDKKTSSEYKITDISEYGASAGHDLITLLREAVDDGRHVVWMPDNF